MNRIYPCVLLMLFALSTIPVEASRKPHHLGSESDKSQSMSDDDEESTVTMTSSASDTEFSPEVTTILREKILESSQTFKDELERLINYRNVELNIAPLNKEDLVNQYTTYTLADEDDGGEAPVLIVNCTTNGAPSPLGADQAPHVLNISVVVGKLVITEKV